MDDGLGTLKGSKGGCKYPLPRGEDLYAKLSGGQKFTKLDLRNAYLQVELQEESKKFVTINTSKALFWCKFSTSHFPANNGPTTL